MVLKDPHFMSCERIYTIIRLSPPHPKRSVTYVDISLIKIRMSNYRHSAIVTSNLRWGGGRGGFSILGDIKSQSYPSHKGNKSSNSDIFPQKMELTLKLSFCVQNRSLSIQN